MIPITERVGRSPFYERPLVFPIFRFKEERDGKRARKIFRKTIKN